MANCPSCDSPLIEEVRPLTYSGIDFGRFKVLACEVCKHTYNPRETSIALDKIAKQSGLFTLTPIERIDISFVTNIAGSIYGRSPDHTQNDQPFTTVIADSGKRAVTSVFTDLCETILTRPRDACIPW